jgi:hypothetical protein
LRFERGKAAPERAAHGFPRAFSVGNDGVGNDGSVSMLLCHPLDLFAFSHFLGANRYPPPPSRGHASLENALSLCLNAFSSTNRYPMDRKMLKGAGKTGPPPPAVRPRFVWRLSPTVPADRDAGKCPRGHEKTL